MAKDISGVEEIISMLNKDKKYPVLNLVKANPQAAAILSKLVRVREQNPVGMNHGGHNIDQAALNEISNSIKERGTDAENMMQLFPDLELSAQILISSIISPKDMMNTEIIYKLANNFLPSELTSTLLKKTKEELEVTYKIKKIMPEILRDILFENGSHIKAVIPESSVDALINDNHLQTNYISTEHLSDLFDKTNDTLRIKNLFLLGSNTATSSNRLSGMSLESFNFKESSIREGTEEVRFALEDNSFTFVKEGNDDKAKYVKKELDKNEINSINTKANNEFSKYLTVSDNFNLLKLPDVIEANNRIKVKAVIKKSRLSIKPLANIGTEGYGSTSLPQIEGPIYHNTPSNTRQFVRIRSQLESKRKSIGRPLVLRLPSESVIPVHVPGDEKHHIGYFIIIDDEGNPISKHNNYKYSTNLQTSLNNSQNSMSSFLLQKSRNNLMGPSDTKNITVDQATRMYAEIIEDDLMQRLKNGRYGTKLAISKSEDIYRIMLARTFANQFTKLVFIPVELVTYFAYRYNKNGVGKTLLDDMRILMSIRAMTTFARVMGSLKNSIGTTEVKLKLDKNDPDPQKTAEIAIHELMRTRQQSFPLGINSPTDIVDWVQRSGMEFTFEGHPKLPDMQFEFSNKSASTTLPDNDLDESLRKSTIQAIGLSPETVDNGFAAEFATTVVANNVLLSKRVSQHQESFEPQLTDHAQKLILNDSLIREDLIKILKDNKDIVEGALSDEEKTEFAQTGEDAMYEYVLEEFVNRLELTLPKPNTTTLNTQMADLTVYIEALEKALPAYINAEIFSSDYAGDIANSIEAITAVVKAGFIRRYLADNNMMPELTDLVSKDEDGKPKVDIYKMQSEHLSGIIASSVGFIKNMSKMKEAANKDLANINEGGEETTPIDNTPTTPETPEGDAATASDNAEDGDAFNLSDEGGDLNEPKEEEEPEVKE